MESTSQQMTACVGATIYVYSLNANGSTCIEHCESGEERLCVPEALDGHPVTGISHSAFANLKSLSELVLPADIQTIGPNAFSKCTNLQRLVLPANLNHVDKVWLVGLGRIEEVVLPDAVTIIDAEFMKACQPQRLVIGRDTHTIDIPALWSKGGSTIVISPSNHHLSIDGDCLYSHDGSLLISCVAESETCHIHEGCRTIGKKAFAYSSLITQVELPSTLEVIGPYAFLSTKLETIELPASTRTIGANAFMRCTHLKSLVLNEGLVSLEEGALSSCTHLEHLTIPASVASIGTGVIADTALVASQPNPTLTIAPDNPTFFFDEQGVLYRRTAAGLSVIDVRNPGLATYEALPGTVEVAESAFAGHPALTSIRLPEGMLTIGENAFKSCKRLHWAHLPSTLRSIGTRAFFNAPLHELDIPASLAFIGSCALATDQGGGTVFASSKHTLHTVRVDAHNTTFFLANGLLCEHAAGYAKAIQYVGPETDVAIPREVTEIAAYAFSGVMGLTTLRLHEGITRIGTMGLALFDPPHVLEVEFAEPHDGRTSISLTLPQDNYGLRGMRNGLASGKVSAAELADQVDRVLPYTRNRNLRMRAMIERLADPFMLSDVMESCFRRTLQRTLTDCVKSVAELEWNEGFDALVDVGVIGRDNIDGVIDEVSAQGHVACTAYLIALKRRRFAEPLDDYAL